MLPWIVYTTGHEINETVSNAVIAGLDRAGADVIKVGSGHYSLSLDDPHIAIFYGILRGTGEIIKHRWEHDLPFVYIDHGYVRPGCYGGYTGPVHFGGYYRFVWNGLHVWPDWAVDYGSMIGKGWNVALDRSRKPHDPVVVVEPSSHIGEFFGFDPRKWAEDEAKKHEGHVVITRKGDGLGESLAQKAWPLITLQSNLAVSALRHGSPVVVPDFQDERIYHPARVLSGTRCRSFRERFDFVTQLASCQFQLSDADKAYRWLMDHAPDQVRGRLPENA